MAGLKLHSDVAYLFRDESPHGNIRKFDIFQPRLSPPYVFRRVIAIYNYLPEHVRLFFFNFATSRTTFLEAITDTIVFAVLQRGIKLVEQERRTAMG